MLIKCPECELQISDKAINCPHCGYPLKPLTVENKSVHTNKRRRLPNGFGQITEIKNKNLRNPFRAMVTVGKTDTGKPICKLLKPVSYFKTYNDAYTALLEYNKNPYDLDSNMTMSMLYDSWYQEHTKGLSESTCNRYKGLWKYCSSLYEINVRELKVYHVKDCIENGYKEENGFKYNPSPSTQSSIKYMLTSMLDYAVEYELIDRNCAKNIKLPKREYTTKTPHISYSSEEIELLWNNIERFNVADLVLIQCYSGWRPQELLNIRLNDIDLDNGYIIGGMKTESGKNRIVPIHSRIRKLIESRVNKARENNFEYLCYISTLTGYKQMTYSNFKNYYEQMVSKLKLNSKHRPHDGRKHFVTMAKRYNVDEYAIKYIVGHSIRDITESVYTERDPAWLKEEIEKID